MKNKPNKIVISGLVFLTAFIALIFCFINYSKAFFIIIGISVLFLISAYFLFNNILNYVNSMDTSHKMLLRNGLNDISSQIEAINSSQTSLNKAIYAYTKKTYQSINVLAENNTVNNQHTIDKLSSIADTQNKSIKALIKYNDSNTNKLISCINEINK